MSVHFYGIPNCDTVKKARAWMDAQGIDYTFHDFKKECPTMDRVDGWIAAKGIDTVLNRRGTTWRNISKEEQGHAETAEGAAALLVGNPSMIKRPIVEHAGGLLVGFDPVEWEAALA